MLRRDGAEPLRVPLRAGRGRRGGRDRLADLAARGPGTWSSGERSGADPLQAVGGDRGSVVAGPSGLAARAAARDAASGLAVALEPLAPHAEARRVRVEDGALLIEGEAAGRPPRGWSRVIAATTPRSP